MGLEFSKVNAKEDKRIKTNAKKAGFILLPGRGKGSHSVYKHPLLNATKKLKLKN